MLFLDRACQHDDLAHPVIVRLAGVRLTGRQDKTLSGGRYAGQRAQYRPQPADFDP